MENIYELNTVTLLEVEMHEKDFEVIADTLLDAAQPYPQNKIEEYLKVHWDNFFNCLQMSTSDDRFLLSSRQEVFREAYTQGIVKIMEENKRVKSLIDLPVVIC